MAKRGQVLGRGVAKLLVRPIAVNSRNSVPGFETTAQHTTYRLFARHLATWGNVGFSTI